MKNIISGMVAGGVAGLAIDGSMNKKGEHDYLPSLVLGAAVGGIGVGVWGAKAAPGLINTSSHHVAPAPTPHVAPAPTQKGPGILSTARTRISSAGALVGEKALEAGKNVWGKLNSDIPTPNIKWPHLPSINVNLDPARQFANKAASASINAISSAGHKLSSSASQVSEKIANKAKKLIATARQNHIPPIRLKAPSINLRMPSMPTNLLSGVQNQIENGIKASSGYVKKGLFAIAVAASSIASHGPSFNPVKPMIEHAQQTMSTSKFGSQAISEFMSDAKQIGSQVMDDITEAIPRALEHPKSTMKEAFGASAIKPATESSVVGNSMGLTNIPMDIMTNIEKEHILSSGIDKNLSYGNALIKSNKTNDLLPEAKAMAELFIARAKKAGLDLRVSETFRNFNQQDAYFAQGRTAPGGIITNAMSGEGLHGYGLALDVYPVVNGSALTTITKDNKKYWDKMGEIGESVGFEWGGRWKEFRDMPHFELNKNISIQDMRRARLGVLDNEQQDMWISKKLKDLDRRSNKESRIEEKTKINEHISNVKKLRKFSF